MFDSEKKPKKTSTNNIFSKGTMSRCSLLLQIYTRNRLRFFFQPRKCLSNWISSLGKQIFWHSMEFVNLIANSMTQFNARYEASAWEIPKFWRPSSQFNAVQIQNMYLKFPQKIVTAEIAKKSFVFWINNGFCLEIETAAGSALDGTNQEIIYKLYIK